jgi:hypothetical protein
VLLTTNGLPFCTMTTSGSSTNNGTTSTTTTTTKECYCCLSIRCGECFHGAGATVFALELLPTMLAVAGATFFAQALLPTMLAGAGVVQRAMTPPTTRTRPPTMIAVAGPAVFAPALVLTMLAEVFAAVCFAVPRPYAALAHGASIHRDILERKRMKHMHWCICLTSLYYWAGPLPFLHPPGNQWT